MSHLIQRNKGWLGLSESNAVILIRNAEMPAQTTQLDLVVPEYTSSEPRK